MESLEIIDGVVVEDTPHPTSQLDTAQLAIAPQAGAIDVQSLFLAARRNTATRRAYVSDFKAFFGSRATAAEIAEFLNWPPAQIAHALESHKAQMLAAGSSEAGINRRLSAIRSLLKFAFRVGAASTDGRGLVDNERVRAYRDTKGIEVDHVKKLLKAPLKLHGRTPELAARKRVLILRDTALIAVLCENGLRNVEMHRLDVCDFSLPNRRLMVLGKGRGTQKQPATISKRAAAAISEYLVAGGHAGDDGPLFRNADHRPEKSGRRLTQRGIHKIITRYGRFLGLDALHPHTLRHTAITNVLVQNKGNIVAAQEFSRHLDPKILMKYWHNSQDMQGEMTDLLSNLYGDDES